jgi:hypothetical protein
VYGRNEHCWFPDPPQGARKRKSLDQALEERFARLEALIVVAKAPRLHDMVSVTDQPPDHVTSIPTPLSPATSSQQLPESEPVQHSSDRPLASENHPLSSTTNSGPTERLTMLNKTALDTMNNMRNHDRVHLPIGGLLHNSTDPLEPSSTGLLVEGSPQQTPLRKPPPLRKDNVNFPDTECLGQEGSRNPTDQILLSKPNVIDTQEACDDAAVDVSQQYIVESRTHADGALLQRMSDTEG